MPLLLRFQWELPAFVADCQIRIQDDEGRVVVNFFQHYIKLKNVAAQFSQ